ncbi:hypothetical protein L7F22_062330 [Adiantum nelumboides]|nr:hypothetical protein [Adiantum nelumboides]
MKKLFDLCMKEEGTISTHINKFNFIFTQLTTQGLVFDEEIKYIILLCILPSSWDTFCTAISNTMLGTSLVYNEVLESLFIEKICRKSLEGKRDGDVCVASDRQRGCTQSGAKSRDYGGSCNKSQDSYRPRGAGQLPTHFKGFLELERQPELQSECGAAKCQEMLHKGCPLLHVGVGIWILEDYGVLLDLGTSMQRLNANMEGKEEAMHVGMAWLESCGALIVSGLSEG